MKIQKLYETTEDLDDLLLEYKPAIEPGSDLEKRLIYDIENTDMPLDQLAKKYGVGRTPIYSLIKRLNLHPSPKSSNQSVIKPNSDLEKRIIYELEHGNKSVDQLAKEYGIGRQTLYNFAHRKDINIKGRPKIRKTKTIKVYFNTLEADVSRVTANGIVATMKFFPSIYVGEYSVGMAQNMYKYIRDKYLEGRPSTDRIIEFYLKIASKEISLNTLITEMKAKSQAPTRGALPANFDYKFITVSTEELSTVDFYSANYPQLAKDILTFLGRKGPFSNDFDNQYKDLKATAAKLDPKTADRIGRINTYVSNNLEKIAHNIYSKKGDIIEPTNYINGIPYETSFDVSSPQNIASCINQYTGYLLYGFMNKTGDIVYIGISVDAKSRARFYENEDRPLILRAFEDNVIKKLIIFKSNLPIQSKSVNTQLIYALEVYFAKQLFNTYPANYPKALNKAKPGKNSSQFLASQNRQNFETYIYEQDGLISMNEFQSAGKEILNVENVSQVYPYYKYAEDYIAKHDGKLSVKDKQILYKSLHGDAKHILWDICASESEYRKIVPKNGGTQYEVDAWKNYRIKNNLPITEDLDDDIDMEYYV